MQSFFKKVNMMMVLLLVLMMVPYQTTSYAAANDYVTVSKTVNPTVITTEQEAEVKLNIQGTPPVNVVMPNDVILIIDKSGSMKPDYQPNHGEDKMLAAKNAAKGFVDLMDMTKHRVGVVDFSSANLTKSLPLTTDKEAAKSYIGSIEANGATATGNAIDLAIKELENHRPEAQPVIVIMTDGDATEPKGTAYEYAKEKAQAAKDAGIVFYTIALLQKDEDPATSGPNKLLKEMATTSAHHHFVLGSVGLSEIYAAIVKEIGMASAYNVQVTDIVSPEFDIVPGSYDSNIPKPIVNGNVLTWNFQELKNSELTFTYKIKPKDPNKKGTFQASTTASTITYKDYAGAARQKAIPSVAIQVNLSAPIITSIEQNFGKPEGGETVSIKGDNFRPGATVTFGTTSATNINVVSKNEITATVPAGAQSTVTVTVKNIDGQKATIPYTYKADPVVTSFDPNNGPLEGGTVAKINGKYFTPGIVVKFGDQIAPMYVYTDSTYFRVKSPKATKSGSVDVTLTNSDGTSFTIPNGFTYNEPVVEKLTVTMISPNIGELAGGDYIFLDGSKFASGVKVYIGSVEAQITTYYSTARVKVKTPAGQSAGAVDVKVVNPDGESVTIPNGFTYNPAPVKPAPELTSIAPDNGLISGGTSVTIQGLNFVKGLKVYFGSTEAVVSSFESSSKIVVTSPVAVTEGSVDVKIVNPDAQEAVKTNGFTYLPIPPKVPLISGLSPDNGPLTGGTPIYIDGQDFTQGLKVYFGGKEAVVNTFYTSARVKVTAPAGTQAGLVDVKVVNPDGQESTKLNGYTYNAPPVQKAPTITVLSPNNGLITGGTIVYIDGADFVQGLKVYFGDKEAVVNTFNSSARLKVTAPAGTAVGAVNVKVVNPDGQEGVSINAYTYNPPPVAKAPTITTLTPNSGPIDGGTVVYIDGANFVQGLKVYFGDKEAVVNTFYSSDRIKVTVPSVTNEGAVDVKITNPDNQSTTAVAGYTYIKPAPLPVTITDISPNKGTVAGGELVIISGTNIQSKAIIQFGNKPAVIDTYYSTSKVRVKAPGSDGYLGNVDVTIINPDGGTITKAQGYTYEAAMPEITLVTPNHGPMAGGTNVYVDGKNFDPDMKLTVNGVPVPVSTYYNNTRFKFISPSSVTSGPVNIVVTNPSTGAAGVGTFTYDTPPKLPAPVITQISPTSGPITGGTSVFIDGSGFDTGCKIYINGVEAQLLTYFNSTRLKVKSPAAGSAGIVDIKIINPDGQESNTKPFEYK
ncbi:IPT/TIG domain-containing protein [Paenibacillus sp. GCM10027629]|uniref:IPT/TIG domain-containing protein n=1 Tax=Paenibacillus sp. GCM10027629 TaxID=3273414 RepID=UPI003631E7E9